MLKKVTKKKTLYEAREKLR